MVSRRRRPHRLLLLGILLAGPALAEESTEPPAAKSWLERPFVTGDWGGARSWLADRGFAPYGVYTAGVWSNVRGGLEKGTRYEGYAHWGFEQMKNGGDVMKVLIDCQS